MSESPAPSQSPVLIPSHWIPLRAGDLTLAYDPAEASLRRIFRGPHEVIRNIYAAVRDPDWRTIPAVIREHRREVGPDSFRIEFEADHHEGDIHFVWHGILRGTAQGTLHGSLDGKAVSSFRKNRIGFCVLHPIPQCAGAPAQQTRTDGTVLPARFPQSIEPQIVGESPFRNLRAVAHEVTPGVWAEIVFEGEVFELEDQRNWTDASFKIYGTPLSLPFPVAISAGTRLQQQFTLRWIAPPQHSAATFLKTEPTDSHQVTPVFRSLAPDTGTPPTTVEVSREPIPSAKAPPANPFPLPLPRWGLSQASHGSPLTLSESKRLRDLAPAHLRVEVRLSHPHWAAHLERAATDATALGVPLELALHLPAHSDADLSQLARTLRTLSTPVVRLLALREGEPATSHATIRAVRHAWPGSPFPIGGGTDAHFCELNREQALGHFPTSEVDFVFWPITPQVHASDIPSILETIEAHGATLATARIFAPGKPCVITPITLKPRFNAVATSDRPQKDPTTTTLPDSVDPRQRTPFAAAWTAGTIAALTMAQAESLTFYETTGWQGITETDDGPRHPSLFPSTPGECFPILEVFAALRDDRTCLDISHAGPLTCLTLANAGQQVRTLFINLADAPLRLSRSRQGQVLIETIPPTPANFWPLPPVPARALPDSPTVGLDGSPLLLGPYGIRVWDHPPEKTTSS